MKIALLFCGGVLLGAAVVWGVIGHQAAQATPFAAASVAAVSTPAVIESISSRKVVLENERVKVFDYLLAPNDWHPGLHTHDYPHADIILNGGTIQLNSADGKTSVLEVVESGKAYYRDGGATHEAVNTGSEPIRMLEVHLK